MVMYVFQNYLIVFFDILGQRESLRKITGIPDSKSEQEKQKFLESIQRSVGKVTKLRGAFKGFFESASRNEEQMVASKSRKEFASSLKENLKFYSLSDATVISVPLTDENENCTAVNGVYSAFTAICAIGLLALAEEIPARAGLSVGVATQIDDHEIYGPALEMAIHIEKELAEYPRFLVGKEVLDYLTWVKDQKCKTKCGEIAKDTSGRCIQMIVQDTDGRFMLDFIGQGIKEALGNRKEFKDVVNAAHSFVKSQYREYMNKDDKLAFRYFRLLRYMKTGK